MLSVQILKAEVDEAGWFSLLLGLHTNTSLGSMNRDKRVQMFAEAKTWSSIDLS